MRKIIFLSIFIFSACISAFPREVRISTINHGLPQEHYAKGITQEYYSYIIKKLQKDSGWIFTETDASDDIQIKSLAEGKTDVLCGVSFEQPLAEQFFYTTTPCSTVYQMIVSRHNDTRFYFNSFEKLSGMRIGYQSSIPSQLEHLDKFTKQYHLAFKKVPYESESQMNQALLDKTIDLCITSTEQLNYSQKVISILSMSPAYFLCAQKETRDTIDRVLETLGKENPFYRRDIALKVNGCSLPDIPPLSEKDLEFLKKGTPVITMCSDESAPISFFQDGEYCGMGRELWDEQKNLTGINFIYKDKSTVRFFPDKNYVYIDAYEGRFTNPYALYTAPFFNVAMRIVFSKHYSPDKKKLTAVLNYEATPFLPFVKRLYPNIKTTIIPDIQDCIEYVESNKADMLIAHDFFFQTMHKLDEYPSLTINEPQTYVVPLSLAIRGPDAESIHHIISASISQYPNVFYETTQPNIQSDAKYIPARRIILTRRILFISAGVLILLFALIITVMFFNIRYKKMAEHDSATGLYNDAKFRREAAKIMQARPKLNYLLINVNIRGFRRLNKLYGMEWGDQLIKEMGAGIRECTKQYSVTLGHGYADNFFIFTPISPLRDSTADIQKFIYDFTTYLDLKNYHVVIKTGTVYAGPDYNGPQTIEDMISKAEFARKTVRESVMENNVVFNSQMQQKFQQEEDIERYADKALKNKEFFLVYQPKISLLTGKIEGAEALIRWNSPELGLIAPNIFIPIFEKNGYAALIDKYVIQNVLEFQEAFNNSNSPSVPISINLSRLHINVKKLVEEINNVFAKFNVQPSQIEFEIIERAAGMSNSVLKDMTNLLHSSGFKVNMDDFGTGESSLNMLDDIPVDIIKLDKCFLDRSDTSLESRIILSKVVEMSHLLGKKVVCEGVENQSQVQFLKSIKCDMVQGYYYSRPLKPEDFQAFMFNNI